ncbi:nucleotidyltransferase domain-containing protein [Demequina sp. NBRC 110051]|uniref:nucleotidyltransferase domain-containing protein n=1 Tax=Demequina sp. NBRC 110051 TaxID=1570340 RepID=UPI000A03FC9E|nr:nucleotidyltransferase domain-containing protein [Demequina sp. NBRC 110051]
MGDSLEQVARRVDATVADARRELVAAIRAASRAGMTQAEIARRIGRSQPEVNRLLRLHGTSARSRTVRANAARIKAQLAEVGGRDVRIFGSTARGDDHAESDVDILFTPTTTLSLMRLSAVERALSDLIGTRVDLVTEDSLREDIRERVLNEAVPL